MDYRRITYGGITLPVTQAEVMQQLAAALKKTDIQLKAERRREETQLHNDKLHKPFWELLAASRRRPICVWHAKKMAAASHRPINTQTRYVMVFTPYGSRCSPAMRRLSFDAYGASEHSRACVEHFRHGSIKKLLSLPGVCRGNLGGYFSRDSGLRFFCLPLFIHAGKLIWACAVFLNNFLIHIHTVTLAHTWELRSTNAACSWRASEGKPEEEEASLRVQIPQAERGFNQALLQPTMPVGFRCKDAAHGAAWHGSIHEACV